MATSSEFMLIETEKGKPMALYEGHRYRETRKSLKGVITWICLEQKKTKCYGKLVTREYESVIKVVPHICVPDIAKNEVKIAVYRAKKRAREEPDAPVSQIYKDEILPLYKRGYQFTTHIPEFHSIDATLYQNRNKTQASECKKRWTNLRDYHMRKKRLGSTSAASGQPDEKLEQFKFLDDTALVHKTNESNMSATDADIASDDNGSYGDGSHVESEAEGSAITHEILIKQEPETAEIQEVEEIKSQEPEVSASVSTKQIDRTTKKRKIQNQTHNRVDRKRARTQMLHNMQVRRSERVALLNDNPPPSTSVMPESPENHIDLFFKSLAATAKTLAPWYLAEAKRKLFFVMAEIEEKNMRDTFSKAISPSLLLSTPSPNPSLATFSDDSTTNLKEGNDIDNPLAIS